MLCQALIAAFAVTCTLSHGQATPRLDRIKDLMCVLLLSGMQKDDLDVSMLTKLRRHNININDMNNEQLLQSCLQPQGNSSNEAKKTKETLPFNKINNNFFEDKTTSHSEVTQYPRTTENYPNTTSTLHQSGHEFQKNNDTALEKNVYDEVKEDKDIRLKLGTRDMKMNIVDDRLMKNQSSLTVQERKRSISEITNSSESDTLNRLLANFLAKRNLSTKPITTPIFINVDDADAKLLYSMPMRDTENNTNGNSALKHHFTYLPIQQIARKSTIQEETIDKESETNRDNPNILNHKKSSDAIILLNTHKSYNPFSPNTEIISNLNSKTTDNLDWSSNGYLSSVQKSDTSTAANIEPKLKISRDIIKEIADNVKEIILRDLRKELHETTTVPTTTTVKMSTKAVHSKRESEFQRTLQNENPNTQDSIMSKFLEMFELFKYLKQNATDIKSETKKDIIKKERSHKIDFKEVNVYPYREIPHTLPNNIVQNQLPYHTNQVNVMKQRPFLNSENNFHFAPHLHEYRSYGSIMNQLPIRKQEPHNDLLPLTVQTNNIEIPPLGIPLDKSQNLIRENIIVRTRAPYNIVPNKNDKSSQSKKGVRHRSIRHLEADKALNRSKYINPRLSNEPHTPPSHNIQPKNNDVIRFTLKNNEDSNYNAHYYEMINLGKYKPQPKSDETNYQEIPRFHEKLENIEHFLDYPEENKNTYRNDCCDWKFGYLKAMVDCCNRKIASRQQMPLNNIKRQSYDDGHFNKFLQSQQKVTDMLERILGDKGTVHSVETA